MVLTFFFFLMVGERKKIKRIPFPHMGNLHDIQTSVSINKFLEHSPLRTVSWLLFVRDNWRTCDRKQKAGKPNILTL